MSVCPDGTVAVGNSLGNSFLNPLFAGLSDTFGRYRFLVRTKALPLPCASTVFLSKTEPFRAVPLDQLFGRTGWILFWLVLGQKWCTLNIRLVLEWGCWGVLQAGQWTVFAASHSDVFGDDPDLSSTIKVGAAQAQAPGPSAPPAPSPPFLDRALACGLGQNADLIYTNATRFLGAIIGPAVQTRWGPRAVFYTCCGLTATSMAIMATMPETLPVDKRKPFSLARANPFGNVWCVQTRGCSSLQPAASLHACPPSGLFSTMA
eukprot:SAG22_NODE_94_length_20824_cov_230.693718_5_plen_262_part_00